MVGIILTLFAVFLVICFAFYYVGPSSARGHRLDTLFYIAPRNSKKKTRGPSL